MGLLDFDPFARTEPQPVERDPMVAVLAAVDQLRAAITDMPVPPAPVVHVEPPDLSEMVMAVQGIKGPATADEIARALAGVLVPAADGSGEATNATMREVAEALRKLDFRMQGMGTQAFGGGAVDLTGRSVDRLAAAFAAATVDAGDTVTPVVATVTAAGDTTIHTPAAGNAIRLVWVSAINDPDEASSPLVTISLGGTALYAAYAVAHRQVFEGAADEPLTVNMTAVASVAVTAHIQEFQP